MPSETNLTICAKCKHVSKRGVEDNYRLWSCLVPFDQELNHVTGEMEPTKIYCLSKNHGNCPDYEEADRD